MDIDLPISKTILSNGLPVIVHQDRQNPLAAISVLYHVGSKNEQPGLTGLAHLFEHLMFQGSKHSPGDYFYPLQKIGARLNGSTGPDRTHYWEVLPASHWAYGLWMESDRLGYLLDALTDKKLENQRDVVLNERRQRYDNRPFGLVYENVLQSIYPAGHPYHHPTIGWAEDIERATMADVQNFFRQHYHPANMTISVCGDIEPDEVFKTCERYFGWFAPGNNPEPTPPAPITLEEQTQVTMEDRTELEKLYLTWPSTPLFADDDAGLDLVCHILGGGRSSRLYHRLVRERGLVHDIAIYQQSGEWAGLIRLHATLKQGVQPEQLEEAILEEVTALTQSPPSDREWQSAQLEYESSYLWDLENIGGFTGRAAKLNLYQQLKGQPDYFRQDIERYRQAEPSESLKLIQKYLQKPYAKLVVHRGKKADILTSPKYLHQNLEPDRKPTTLTKNKADPIDRNTIPQGEVSTRKVKQTTGQKGAIFIAKREHLPLSQCLISIPVGSSQDPENQQGISRLTTALIDQGTKQKSAQEVAQSFAQQGSFFVCQSSVDETKFLLSSLSKNFATSLGLVAEILEEPAFTEQDTNRLKEQTIARIQKLRTSPDALATYGIMDLLYPPDHPYGRRELGWESGVTKLENPKAHYDHKIRTHQPTYFYVGEENHVDLIEAHFTKQEPTPSANFTQVPVTRTDPSITLIDLPKAAQSVVALACHAPARTHEDYFALVLMDAVLGGQFSSRLNLNLREDKGITYGIRSQFVWRRRASYYCITTSVDSQATARAVEEIAKEIKSLTSSHPITAVELAFVKGQIGGSIAQKHETSRSLIMGLSRLYDFGLPLDYYDDFMEALHEVTLDQVNQVACQFFQSNTPTTLVVGDQRSIQATLEKQGDVKPAQFDQRFRLQHLG